jgi:hypothetical protein
MGPLTIAFFSNGVATVEAESDYIRIAWACGIARRHPHRWANKIERVNPGAFK